VARVYLGLGANLGDREANLKKALQLLAARLKVEKVSSFYETEPVGYADQPRFLNAVCEGTTGLEPLKLLRYVKDIERKMGRKRTFRYAPRLIDIDILLYDDNILETPGLVLPHQRLAERAFVLVPLAEIAPETRHPVTGQTARQMAGAIDKSGVVLLGVKKEGAGA